MAEESARARLSRGWNGLDGAQIRLPSGRMGLPNKRAPAAIELFDRHGERESPARPSLGRLVLLLLLASLPPSLLDFLGQAAGEAARPDGRAAADPGRADRF